LASVSQHCEDGKKEETRLRDFMLTVDDVDGLARKKAKLPADIELDKSLFTWFVQQRNEGVPLSGPMLQAKAEKLDGALNGPNSKFVASSGWLWRFKKRHSISRISLAGEIRSADDAAANEFPDQLKQFIATGGYCEEQIYNCDETGLCYKMLPSKTLAVANDPHKHEGFKKLKERVALLFAVNRTGSHKLKPLCIGHSKSPRCFHHVNLNALPMDYRSSKNAWMTSAIFDEWFFKVPNVRRHLRMQKVEEKAVLLLDNCAAHPPGDQLVTADGKIRVLYLPKNTTSKIQPLDQGIISAFKAHYRREMVKAMIDSSLGVSGFLKTLNMKEVIYMSATAWAAVSPATIYNCWSKGLGAAFERMIRRLSARHQVSRAMFQVMTRVKTILKALQQRSSKQHLQRHRQSLMSSCMNCWPSRTCHVMLKH